MVDNHYRNWQWKKAFAVWKFNAYWSRYEKRMLRTMKMRQRKFYLRKSFKGLRNAVYDSKRESYHVANTKRCELEVQQLLSSKNYIRLTFLVQEEMKLKLKSELEQRNLELDIEERRLNELNKKYSELKQSDSPAMILRMHDDLKSSQY